MERRKPSRGNKKSFQVLLDPHRAELLNAVAADSKEKPTSLLRSAAYELIRSNVSESAYEEALLKDEALWTKAIEDRVQTCSHNRKVREERIPS